MQKQSLNLACVKICWVSAQFIKIDVPCVENTYFIFELWFWLLSPETSLPFRFIFAKRPSQSGGNTVKCLMLRNVPEVKGKVNETQFPQHELCEELSQTGSHPISSISQHAGLSRKYYCLQSADEEQSPRSGKRPRASVSCLRKSASVPVTFLWGQGKGWPWHTELLRFLLVAPGALAVIVYGNRKELASGHGQPLVALWGTQEPWLVSAHQVDWDWAPNFSLWPSNSHLLRLIRAPKSWGWGEAQGDQWKV